MRSVAVGICYALLIVACQHSESVETPSIAMQPKVRSYDVSMAHSSTRLSHPVSADSAAATEAALLNQISAHLPSDKRQALLGALARPGSRITSTADPVLSDLLEKYYAARTDTRLARHRETSAAAARFRGARVLVVIAKADLGTQATILRKRLSLPQNVILLPEGSTAETLAGAFAALEGARAHEGDDLLADERIGVREVQARDWSAPYKNWLDTLIGHLRTAPNRQVDGIGVARAIEVRLQPAESAASGK